jgi:bla regulator protein BlaR1
MNPDAWDSWLTAAVWSEPLHRLGQTFLHSLWQGAAAAAVLAVALRVLPRRSAVAVQIRYGLATLALVALPVAALVTYAFTEPPAGAVARQPVAESRGAGGGTPVASGRNETRPTPAATPRAVAGGVPDLFVGAPRVIESCLPWCGCAWLLGVALAALRVATGCSVTRRLVAGAAAPLDPRWQARLRGWQRALGIGRRIRLLVSAQVDVPMVVGWARPVVLWPLTACVGLSPDQLDAILVHELAHVRRHDVLVNILQAWIEAVFFHHPAAWWISAQVRAEREYCADEMAVRVLDAGRGEARLRQARRADTRLAYARALVAIEERRQRAVLAVAADGGSLVRRVHRLVAVEPCWRRSRWAGRGPFPPWSPAATPSRPMPVTPPRSRCRPARCRRTRTRFSGSRWNRRKRSPRRSRGRRPRSRFPTDS